MSRKKIVLIAIAIVVVALIVFTIRMQNGNSETIEVQTSKVKRQKIVQTVTATGRIQPKTQVKISADVSAKIMRLGVKEGDWVEKGDFLVELDRERYLAEVESVEANLRSVQATAKLARENMLKAEKDYLRTKELFDKNLESQATLDAIEAAYEVEKARYESMLDQVEQARAAVKQAKDALSKTTIYAPMAGTISQLNKEVGEIALGSQFQEDVIMIVSNLSGMEALVDVDENDIVSVSLGDSAAIEVDALPDLVLRGEVTEIANSAKISGAGSADQKTEFEVKVAIADPAIPSTPGTISSGSAGEVKMTRTTPGEELRPGMTASSDIVTDVQENAIAVPIQSVAVRTVEQLQRKAAHEKEGNAIAEEAVEQHYTPDRDGFVEVVFVVKEGGVEARQVKTGIQSETHIEIIEGLSEGEEVVIGSYRAISKDLQNGSPIAVKNDKLEQEKG